MMDDDEAKAELAEIEENHTILNKLGIKLFELDHEI